MMVLPRAPFVIADLEYTSWEGAHARNWAGPGEFREIVQIGAVRVSGDDLSEADAFMALVRPTMNPVLSDYFIDLTGITNEAVARDGMALPDALADFAMFVGELPILAHGRDDVVVIEECAEKQIANPLAAADWHNIAPPIRAITGDQLMSSELPEFFGLEMPGRAHDALADARALRAVLVDLTISDRS